MGSGKGIPLLGGGRRDFLPGLLFVKGLEACWEEAEKAWRQEEQIHAVIMGKEQKC